MHFDTERRLRAAWSRDPRFDGWFFTAVLTTGIYCRPSCPAVPPKPENMRFYPSAAAAQQAGYRACKRCRPDASPGSPEWDTRADLTARAMRLIADGIIDRAGVPGLAAALGYSVRQVERQLLTELGAGPLALARAQRAQTARLLIETTWLPMGQIAFAAGFASIRAFNDTVRAAFAQSPSQLRQRAAGRKAAAAPAAAGTLALRLPFRAPLCPDNLFGHLAATAVPGVEEWRDGSYRRTLALPRGPGIAALRPEAGHIGCTLALADLRDLPTAISRCRRLLDLDADPEAVDGQLSADPALAPLVAKAPGRRVPRSTDPDEMAIRAVLGQQVSTAAARTHAARLAAALGEPVADPGGGLTRLFPAMSVLAQALAAGTREPAGRTEAAGPARPIGLTEAAQTARSGSRPPSGPPGAPAAQVRLALPAARRASVAVLAAALAAGAIDLGAGADWLEARRRLAALPGLGSWTVETIAMRALGDPDAFIGTDLGVRGAAARLGLPVTHAALTRRAAGWRPWRAYAVQYLWATGDHEINRLPGPARDPRT